MKNAAPSSRRRDRLVPDVAEKLRCRDRKLTGQRQSIVNLLVRHAHPMTIREIFAGLEPGVCDLATVYRSMHLLEGMGLVKRFDFGDGAARFELLADGAAEHHHHLICTRCTAVVEIEECFNSEIEQRIAARNGFTAVTHRLEFFGICPRCQ
jgi:Fur family transcriptional regulator, ferric uptake regulator